ncbi:MAG TPA: EpsI family protein [Terriglobia bacterium]|nr:EpsI family protein [Terriglobia bacterium]
MLSDPLRRRIWITAALLVAGTIALHGVSHGERVPLRKLLGDFPLTVGIWQGRNMPFSENVIQAAGVTDYINRVYTDRKGDSVNFYIGYYASQRTGDTIHSPKHCLPGGGWTPLRSSKVKIDLKTRGSITVNDYLIGKGLERQVVLYWYQSQGRVVASEYWARYWLIVDAIIRDRTDGALVRVIAPANDDVAQARALAVGFVQNAFPDLKEYLPN